MSIFVDIIFFYNSVYHQNLALFRNDKIAYNYTNTTHLIQLKDVISRIALDLDCGPIMILFNFIVHLRRT